MSGNVFEYVKNSVPISRVIGDYVELKSTGATHKGLCPFHGEKTPSFHVDDAKGMFYCFGCRVGGDVIKFVSEYERLDPIDACKLIADKYGLDISQYLGKRRNADDTVLEVLKDAAMYFRSSLKASKAATTYAVSRGIDREAAQRFMIGYAKDGYNNLCGALASRHSKDALLRSGLFGNKDGRLYDKFRNRLIFPIIDQRGRIVGFGGRTLVNDPAKYLNSPEAEHFKKGELLYALYNCKDHIKGNGHVIVTEGYMDVIALSIHGINNAVATLGTAMTEHHAELLARYTDHVVICYDSDKAGIKAALSAVDTLSKRIPTVKVCKLGEGLDPDEYIKKYGAEEFKKAIANAKLGMVYKIDHLADQYDLNSTDTYNRFLREAIVEIRKLDDILDKNTYSQYLVEEYDADPALVSKLSGAYGVKEKRQRPKSAAETAGLTEEEMIIRVFAENHRAITESPDTLKRLLDVEFSEDIGAIFYGLVSYFEEKDELDYSEIAEYYIDMELTKRLQRIVETELSGDAPNIEILILGFQLAKVTELIKQKPAPHELQRLSAERIEIMNKISGERSKI